MVAEEVVKGVSETAEENANANTEESGENVAAEVPAKKKNHPGPMRRSFQIKTAVIKKGAKHKGPAVPCVISSDGRSSSEKTKEEDDEGNAEQGRNRSDTEEETQSEES